MVLHCHGLLKSFETVCYCCSSILSVFCDHCLAGSKLAIDDRSSLHYQLTPNASKCNHLIASKCNHFARTMLLSACLDFSGGLFELATFCFSVHATASHFRLDKQNGDVTVFLPPTVDVHCRHVHLYHTPSVHVQCTSVAFQVGSTQFLCTLHTFMLSSTVLILYLPP